MTWSVEVNLDQDALVLRSGNRRAFFARVDVISLPLYASLPSDPLQKLSILIRQGLRPYRVDGIALPAQELHIEDFA